MCGQTEKKLFNPLDFLEIKSDVKLQDILYKYKFSDVMIYINFVTFC